MMPYDRNRRTEPHRPINVRRVARLPNGYEEISKDEWEQYDWVEVTELNDSGDVRVWERGRRRV